MHVKTNDKVVVIAGADKGKVTEVVEVFEEWFDFVQRRKHQDETREADERR